jgi:leader peptidase (prepilin peptidase)/N-methyltransferase
MSPATLASAAVLAAGAAAVMVVRFGLSPVLPAFGYLAAVGVALACIDAHCKRLPDTLTLPSYPVALWLLGLAAMGQPGGTGHFADALVGMTITGAFFTLQAVIYPAGLGWGDVKLAGILGLYLGWLGPGALIAGLFLGYLLAAVAGLALIAAGRATRKSHLPFGPFLLAGALVAIAATGLVGSHFPRSCSRPLETLNSRDLEEKVAPTLVPSVDRPGRTAR